MVSLLGAASGCAAADPPVEEEADMSGEDAEEMGPPVDTSDMRDMPPQMPDQPSADLKEMGPPMICTPNASRCGPGGEVITCSADGLSESDSMCEEREICEDGACVPEPICEPGTARCSDPTTRLVCRPGGTAEREEPCAQGEACIQGTCASGAQTAALCTSADECAGGRCHCGDGTDEECMDAFAAPSYCTAPCQNQTECSSGEWCFDSQVHLIAATDGNYDHCVARCQGSCSKQGLECKWAPVIDAEGALTWGEACYFPDVKEIGEECASDAECIGGTCLMDFFSTGYCTRPCDGADGCPPGSACVDLNGTFYCSQECVDETCPLEAGGDDRLDVTCTFKSTRGGGGARVCDSTNSP